MRVPEYYSCDIKGCENEVPTTSTGKRDYVTAHVARLTEFTGDRLVTLPHPILEEKELDLCPKHFDAYIQSLPIRVADDGFGGDYCTIQSEEVKS